MVRLLLKIKFIAEKLELILAQIVAANYNELFMMVFGGCKCKWTNTVTLGNGITGISLKLCLSSHGNELAISFNIKNLHNCLSLYRQID